MSGASRQAADDVIERGLVAAAIAYVRQGGGIVHDEPVMTWVSTGTRIPFYNGVIRTRLSEGGADRAIEAIVGRFQESGWLMAWWVMPSSQPADLARRLEAHGFVPWGSDLGMAADLAAVPEAVPLPEGLSIERVRTRQALEDWLRAFGAGFSIPEPWLAIYGRLPLGAAPEDSLSRFFLARHHGVPVATSLWFPAADAAVIDEIATVPDFRRRGIGTAVTHAALRDARSSGYRTAVLVASEAGAPIYRRLGFVPHGRRQIYQLPAPRL